MMATTTNGIDTHTDSRYFVSILAPAYNEAALLENSVNRIYTYMETLEETYDWELIIVNDGSKDKTGEIADRLSAGRNNMRVYHHVTNRNLGAALLTGFKHCRGTYIVVLDIDLSYAPEHIGRLLTEAIETEADIVVASPYMKGGKNTNVPFFRLMMSKMINLIMQVTSPEDIHTFTGMVRAYRSDFIKHLNLKSITYSINPEIINKASILRGHIREIPAHLDWSFNQKANGRASSVRIAAGILGGLMNSFIFRPYALFMSIGTILMLISIYVIVWIFIHTFNILPEYMPAAEGVENAFSLAVAEVFRQRSYSFLVGGVTLIASIQFLSLGFLSLQNKRYFDELFHLGTSVFKRMGSGR